MGLWDVNVDQSRTNISPSARSALKNAIDIANSLSNANTSSNTSTNTNANTSTNTVTTSDTNVFNPVFAPVNNISLAQEDSSSGKSNNQRGDPNLDIVSNPSTKGGDSRTTADIKSSATSDTRASSAATAAASSSDGVDGLLSGGQLPAGLMSALGAAAAGYLISYALDFSTSNSVMVSAINGVSNLAGGIVTDAAQLPGGMLTGTGIGVGCSFGGMYFLGLDLQSSLGIAMAGGVGGAAVGYLSAR